jgi:hypothetical protein
MEKLYLFLLALCAVKPDESFIGFEETDTGVNFTSELAANAGGQLLTKIRLLPTAVLAPSVMIAEEMGLDIIRSKYPVEEGWLSHVAEMRIMEKEKLMGIIPMISEGGTVETDNAAADADPVM